MFGLGAWDMMIVLVIAVLLFGKRLPEVARSLGKGVTEFRKGIRGIEDEIRTAENSPPPSARPSTYEDRDEPTAPRFVPPPENAADSQAADHQQAERAAT